MNMDKNEILERSRKENQGADLVELEVGRKSSGIAGAASLCIGAVLNLISTFFFDTPMHLFWVMFFSYSAAQGISRLILDKRRGRKTQGIWIFYGFFMAAAAILAIVRLFRFLKEGSVNG